MKNIILLLTLLTTTFLFNLNLPAATNCGSSLFTSDAPNPVTGDTNWLIASWCGLNDGEYYEFSRMNNVTGVGTPGPIIAAWVGAVDMEFVWYPNGYVPNYIFPGTGKVTIYVPVTETNQIILFAGPGSAPPITTGPSIVPTVKGTKGIASMKGATALLAGIQKRKPVNASANAPKPPELPLAEFSPPSDKPVGLPVRHIDWAAMHKYPMRKL